MCKEVKGTNRLRDAPLLFFPFARQGKGYSKILEIIKRYIYSFFFLENMNHPIEEVIG